MMFSIYERANLELRSEFFNVFNNPQFFVPDADTGDAEFGVVATRATQESSSFLAESSSDRRSRFAHDCQRITVNTETAL